jgi:predicted outer membrane repeat protein
MNRKFFTILGATALILVTITANAAITNIFLNSGGTGGGTSWTDAKDFNTYFGAYYGKNSAATAIPASTHIFIQGGASGTPKVYSPSSSLLYLINSDILIQGGFNPAATNADTAGFYAPATYVTQININSVFASSTTGHSGTAEIKGIKFNGGTYVFDGRSDGYASGSGIAGTYKFTDLNIQNTTSLSGAIGFSVGSGTTYLTNCLMNNTGGIYNQLTGNPLTISNSVFTNNTAGNAANSGSAIYSLSDMTITNSSFCGNSAGSPGGGALGTGTGNSNSPHWTLTGCTFSGNSAFQGGAIYSSLGYLSLTNCSFYNNTASTGPLGGGAIFMNGAQSASTATGCLFYGNQANGAAGSGAGGGAISIQNGQGWTINTSTFVSNSTVSTAGGAINIYNNSGNTAVTVNNSLFDKNTGAATGPDIYMYRGGSYSSFTMNSDTVQLSPVTSYAPFQLNTGTPYTFTGLTKAGNTSDTVTTTTFTCPSFTQIQILPITLTSFSGVKTPAGNLLSWTASNAVNFAHFELQRSTSGSSFATLATVAVNASGSYSYTDAGAIGTNYYRLAMVDLDGSITYSKTVAIVGDGSSFAVARIYPNPATSLLNIALYTPATVSVTYTITDISGRVMGKEVHAASAATTQQISVSNLARGTYLITVDANGTKSTSKFTKL